MKLALLLLFASIAQATSVTVPISVTVTDKNCQAWTISGTNITCTDSPAPPVPPSGWPPACANKSFTMDWGTAKRYYTSDYGNFDADDLLVIRVIPTTVTTRQARIAGAEYGSSPSARQVTISTTPCDFGPQPWPGASVPSSNSPTLYFTVTQQGSPSGYYPNYSVNTPLYINVRNVPGSTCAATGACNMFWDLAR